MAASPVGPPSKAWYVASLRYLARTSLSKVPQDLIHHECIGFRVPSTGVIERWRFEKNSQRIEINPSGRGIVVNDGLTLTETALEGLGIVYMHNGYIEPFVETRRLQRVLEYWNLPLPGDMLYYPSRVRDSRALHAFIDYLRLHPSLESQVGFMPV